MIGLLICVLILILIIAITVLSILFYEHSDSEQWFEFIDWIKK